MLNIIIYAYELSSIISKVKYENTKPCINISSEEIIIKIIKNLEISNAKYIIILQEKYANQFRIALKKIQTELNAEFILTDSIVKYAYCTTLKIKDDDELLLVNSNQIINLNLNDFINNAKKLRLDGSFITIKDLNNNSRLSLNKIKNKLVNIIIQKQIINENIDIDIYYFKNAKYFTKNAIDIIKTNNKISDKLLIISIFNHLMKENKNIKSYKIQKTEYIALKTSKDLNQYLKLDRFIIEKYINNYEFNLLNTYILSKLLNKQASFDFLKYAFLSAQFKLFFQIYNIINNTSYILTIDCLKSDGLELLKEFTANNKKQLKILKEYFEYFSNYFNNSINIDKQKIEIDFNDFIIIGCYILKTSNNNLKAECVKNIVPFLKKANTLFTQVLSIVLIEYFILRNEEEKEKFFGDVISYGNFINILLQDNYQKSYLKFIQYNELTSRYYTQKYKYLRKKRYAVCLYGMLRGDGWIKSIEKIIADISKYFEADFFLFAWDECQIWANCSPWINWANRFFIPQVFQKIPKCIASTKDFKTLLPLTSECFLKNDIKRKITKEEINNLLINNPKIKLSNFEKQPNHIKKLFVANLYYGQLASFNLLKKYEKQSNIEYDIVMLCRNDLEIININMDIVNQLKVGEISDEQQYYGLGSTHLLGHRSAINEYVKFYEDFMHNHICSQDFNYGNHHNLLMYSQIKKIKYKPKALKDSLFFRNIIFNLKLPHFNKYLEQDLNNSNINIEEKEQINSFFKLLSKYYDFS